MPRVQPVEQTTADPATLLGRLTGFTEEETKEARRAGSHGARERASLVFARTVVRDRGVVAGADLEDVRRAGYTEGKIGEIVANVALGLIPNDFNHVAGTDPNLPAPPDVAA